MMTWSTIARRCSTISGSTRSMWSAIRWAAGSRAGARRPGTGAGPATGDADERRHGAPRRASCCATWRGSISPWCRRTGSGCFYQWLFSIRFFDNEANIAAAADGSTQLSLSAVAGGFRAAGGRDAPPRGKGGPRRGYRLPRAGRFRRTGPADAARVGGGDALAMCRASSMVTIAGAAHTRSIGRRRRRWRRS